MTGFARNAGEHDGLNWVWEIKSVNGKGLDMRFRVPPGFEAVEAEARKLVDQRLGRGNLQVNLQTSGNDRGKVPVINVEALETLLATSRGLAERNNLAVPTLSDILSIRGIVELEESNPGEDEREALHLRVIESFNMALDQLVADRTQEGAAIRRMLADRLAAISELAGKIEADKERSPEAVMARLTRQVARVLNGHDDMLDPQRLHQEVALLATKADIDEELDRLKVHLASATQLLEGNGPVGRKLDFLSQEFNRECNTICSKSGSAAISTLGVDMKLVIDQFREQVQNLE